MKKLLIIVLACIVCMAFILCSCSEQQTAKVITLDDTTIEKPTDTSIDPINSGTSSTQIPITTNSKEILTETTANQEQTGVSWTKEYVINDMTFLIFRDVFDETTKKSDGTTPFMLKVNFFTYDENKEAIENNYTTGKFLLEGDMRYLFGGEGVEYYGARYATEIVAKEKLYFHYDRNTVVGSIRIYDTEGNLKHIEDIENKVVDISSLDDGEYIVTIEIMHKQFEIRFGNGEVLSPGFDMSYAVLRLIK